jgi:aminoglycoside/choline kinase family phosphotransferase
MADRADRIAAFLDAAGWGSAARHPLAGDASERRYLRLAGAPGETAVLMDAPPDRCGDTTAFVAIARHLLGLGLSAPRLLAEDAPEGLLLLEDLGDGIFARLIAEDPAREPALCAAAAETLAALQAAPPPAGLTPFTPAHMAGLVRIAFDWYAPATPAAEADAIVARLEDLLDTFAPRPTVLALRDVHAENLLWLPDRDGPARTGLLDFQDAVLAHPAYDLVSLLDDARRDVGAPAREAATRRFLDLTGHEAEPFAAAAAALSLQRNLRILGVFARLARRDGKTGYLRHLPRVRGHIRHALDHPALDGLTGPLLPLLAAEAPCATPVP